MRVRNFGREAQTALESEAARLAAQPPPPATAATGAAPMDEGAAQNDSTLSGVVRRPRGNAPKGKVWSGGQWVDASAVVARSRGEENVNEERIRIAIERRREVVADAE